MRWGGEGQAPYLVVIRIPRQGYSCRQMEPVTQS